MCILVYLLCTKFHFNCSEQQKEKIQQSTSTSPTLKSTNQPQKALSNVLQSRRQRRFSGAFLVSPRQKPTKPTASPKGPGPTVSMIHGTYCLKRKQVRNNTFKVDFFGRRTSSKYTSNETNIKRSKTISNTSQIIPCLSDFFKEFGEGHKCWHLFLTGFFIVKSREIAGSASHVGHVFPMPPCRRSLPSHLKITQDFPKQFLQVPNRFDKRSSIMEFQKNTVGKHIELTHVHPFLW